MADSVWDLYVHTDVDACDCTRGRTDTALRESAHGGRTDTVLRESAHGGRTNTVLRETALEVDSGKKNPLPHRGLEPASVLRLAFQSDRSAH